ncbi:MAG: hypothetical protein RLZZ528_2398 [Pseudomonadota bacterium]
MARQSEPPRKILLLQGPHGPFFRRLADLLGKAGCEVWRVGFNGGDRLFWSRDPRFIAYRGTTDGWGDFLSDVLGDLEITDIALYGDVRPLHATAAAIARARGITLHVFEEGYVRPFWVTYERAGSNGNSPLMRMNLPQIRAALERSAPESIPAPARWGDMRQHVFYGAIYHFFVLLGRWRYPLYQPHRGIGVLQEFRLHLRRLILMPVHHLGRWLATRRVRRGGFPYHLVMLQLEHDASFQTHSPFASMTEFIDLCLGAFADGAPAHHHIVFKAHPLEDGRAAIAGAIRAGAARQGLTTRVHFIRGGKLAGLLEQARSAVTVNSTAAHQALWRGLPVRALGRAIYGLPEIVSSKPLKEFFAEPDRSDATAYRDFRRYLLETCQVPGGFYSAKGRQRLLRQVVDMMLAEEDPYEALVSGKAAPRQQLTVVR